MICEHIVAPIYFDAMKNIEIALFGDRLKWSRKNSKRTQKEVQALAGIGQGSLSELENNLHKSSTFTPILARLYGVNAYWLATGEGEAFGISDPSFGANLTNIEIDSAEKPFNNTRPPVMEWPEIIRMKAGEDQMLEFDGAFRYLYEGDLMSGPKEPIIPSGSIIKINVNGNIKPGRVVVADVAGKPIIGVYDEVGPSIFLCPTNKQYNAVEVQRAQIIGHVVSFERALP